jgi:hypothetical protein
MRLLLFLKAEIAFLLALITYFTLQVAVGQLTQMPGFMLPFVLSFIFGTIAVYFWQVLRLKN